MKKDAKELGNTVIGAWFSGMMVECEERKVECRSTEKALAGDGWRCVSFGDETLNMRTDHKTAADIMEKALLDVKATLEDRGMTQKMIFGMIEGQLKKSIGEMRSLGR